MNQQCNTYLVPANIFCGLIPIPEFEQLLPLPTCQYGKHEIDRCLLFHLKVYYEAVKCLSVNSAEIARPIFDSLCKTSVDHVVLKKNINHPSPSVNMTYCDLLQKYVKELSNQLLEAPNRLFIEPKQGDVHRNSCGNLETVFDVQASGRQQPGKGERADGESSVENPLPSRVSVGACDRTVSEFSTDSFRFAEHCQKVVVVQLEAAAQGEYFSEFEAMSSGSSTEKRDRQECVRKKILSIGKQPKAMMRKKKDIVSELFDSLTPGSRYFAEGSRRRRVAPRSYNEEQLLTGQPGAHPGVGGVGGDAFGLFQKSNSCEELSLGESESTSERGSPSSQQNQAVEFDERPLTPPDVIQERERQWNEIIKRRKEKERKRAEAGQNLDAFELAQLESYKNFSVAIDAVSEIAEEMDLSTETADNEDEIPAEYLIPKKLLGELCSEGTRLKAINAMHRVPLDKVTKLITVLDKNVKDSFKCLPTAYEILEGEDTTLREQLCERLQRSVDAAYAVLTVMTSAYMPKQVYIEDAIERITSLTKSLLESVIYPIYDCTYRLIVDSKGVCVCVCFCFFPSSVAPVSDGKLDEAMLKALKKAKNSTKSSRSVQKVYCRLAEVISALGELVSIQSLTDTTVLQMSSLGVNSFFVENISDLQMSSLRLLSTVFGRYEKHRQLILEEILASLYRLPTAKRGIRSYRQAPKALIRSTIEFGMFHTNGHGAHYATDADDNLPRPACVGRRPCGGRFGEPQDCRRVRGSSEAESGRRGSVAGVDRLRGGHPDGAQFFVRLFEKVPTTNNNNDGKWLFVNCCRRFRCTTKCEEDYKSLFEDFVRDLLAALNRPEWPVAELLLKLLGTVLQKHCSSKQGEVNTRVAALEYLGMVAARIRRDVKLSVNEDALLGDLVRKFTADSSLCNPFEIYAKDDEENGQDVQKDVEVKKKVLQKALNFYLMDLRSRHNTIEFARRFHIAQWIRDVSTELDRKLSSTKDENRYDDADDSLASKTAADQQRHQEAFQRANEAKAFLLSLIDVDDDVFSYVKLSHGHGYGSFRNRPHKNANFSSLALFWLTVNGGRRQTKSGFLNCPARQVQNLRVRWAGSLREAFILHESQAISVVRFLARKRPLMQSFDRYLIQQRTKLTGRRLFCVQIIRLTNDSAVAVRTKAMKCLAAAVEIDPEVLSRTIVQKNVLKKVLDQSSNMREAAVDLIGKLLNLRPDLLEQYYSVLTERLLDTGVSVRKRTIRILKEVCERRPDFDKIPEICSRILKRTNDEESILKLICETFHSIWLTPARDHDPEAIMNKVVAIIDVVSIFGREGGQFQPIETLLKALLKDVSEESSVSLAARQIMRCLVEHVLVIEEKLVGQSVIIVQGLVEQQQQLPAFFVLLVHHLRVQQSRAAVDDPLHRDYAAIFVDVVQQFGRTVRHDSGDQNYRIGRAIDRTSESEISQTTREILATAKDEMNKAAAASVTTRKPLLTRSLFTCGALFRYFDFDIIIQTENKNKVSER
ncbi:putative HEAT repeat-containing domain protein [Trichinella spiralis]|uniref:putative HEAT repeat-containing domain protein n=1 Tax=Trichinella spiralis TaxID=6334 RepID=UPI0001EFDD6D|nr:putative HEAT repeat-containing domain protein [Trichinella spiralis]